MSYKPDHTKQAKTRLGKVRQLAGQQQGVARAGILRSLEAGKPPSVNLSALDQAQRSKLLAWMEQIGLRPNLDVFLTSPREDPRGWEEFKLRFALQILPTLPQRFHPTRDERKRALAQKHAMVHRIKQNRHKPGWVPRVMKYFHGVELLLESFGYQPRVDVFIPDPGMSKEWNRSARAKWARARRYRLKVEAQGKRYIPQHERNYLHQLKRESLESGFKVWDPTSERVQNLDRLADANTITEEERRQIDAALKRVMLAQADGLAQSDEKSVD